MSEGMAIRLGWIHGAIRIIFRFMSDSKLDRNAQS
jgi:hypothetical protein